MKFKTAKKKKYKPLKTNVAPWQNINYYPDYASGMGKFNNSADTSAEGIGTSEGVGESMNLKESLNKLDILTSNQYDLLNQFMYKYGVGINAEDKAKIVNILSEGLNVDTAKKIYEAVNLYEADELIDEIELSGEEEDTSTKNIFDGEFEDIDAIVEEEPTDTVQYIPAGLLEVGQTVIDVDNSRQEIEVLEVSKDKYSVTVKFKLLGSEDEEEYSDTVGLNYLYELVNNPDTEVVEDEVDTDIEEVQEEE